MAVRTDSTTVIYGPFFRAESPTQTADVVREILASGELWGRSPRGSDIPAVQALRSLRPGQRGVEFYSFVPPDNEFGPVLYWRERLGGGVWQVDDTARMQVLIAKVSQDIG